MSAILLILILLVSGSAAGAVPAGEVLWLPGRGPGIALLNPALLADPTPTDFGVKLPGWGMLATNNSFSVSFWNARIAGDDYWDAAEIRQILDRIPAKGLEVQAQFAAPVFGLRYKQWAFNAELLGAGWIRVPKAVAELALLGTRLNESYDLSDFIAESFFISRYSLGFGHPVRQNYLPDLKAGITVHYYQGLLLAQVDDFQGNLRITDEVIEGSGVFRAGHGLSGHGIGVDLGLACTLSPRWQVGLVCQQIGATMDWKLEKTVEERFEMDLAGLDMDSLGEEGYLDSVLTSHSTTTHGGRTTLRLPVTLRATAMFVANSQWSFTGEISCLTQGSPLGKAGAEIGTGATFRARRWAVLQGGVILGGPHRTLFMLGTGLRFHHYELDLEFFTRGLFCSTHGGGLGVSQRVFF